MTNQPKRDKPKEQAKFMGYSTPRGTRDFMPDEMAARLAVQARLREAVGRFGFKPVETPAFESFELLAKKSGDEIKNQIYVFRDKNDRELGLRFDGTVPVARVVATHPELAKPIKWYYLGRFWRYEEPQSNRYREFWQLGIELIGAKNPVADAEVIAAAVGCLTTFGLEKIEVKLNSRKILEGFAEIVGLTDPLPLFRLIDKREKISKSEFAEEVEKLGITKLDEIEKLIELKGNPKEVLGAARKAWSKAPRLFSEGLDELEAVCTYLTSFDLEPFCTVDLGVARGLDYYTGVVFEIRVGEAAVSVVGGGRYDELLGIYGREALPATGWGLGVDRLVEVLRQQKKLPPTAAAAEILVIPVGETTSAAIGLVTKIREQYPADIELMGKNLRKALEYANKEGYVFAVIVGEKDLKDGAVTVRNLRTGKEEKVAVGRILTAFAH